MELTPWSIIIVGKLNVGVGVVGRMCCGSQTNLEHSIDSVPDEVSWVVFVCHGLFSVLYRQYMVVSHQHD